MDSLSPNFFRRKASGFTLLEAMIALVIGATALYWASSVQIGSLNRLFLRAGELSRIYEIKSELYRFFIKPQKSATKVKKATYEFPPLQVSTFYEDIPKKSSLHFWSSRIRCVRSEGKWENKTVAKNPIITSLITWVVTPLPKKSSS